MKSVIGLILVLTIGFLTIGGLSDYVKSIKPELPETIEDEDLTLQASKLKGFSLGFEGLIADWYWMRSLQYLGGKISKVTENKVDIGDMRSLNPRLLHPLLDSATTLDPKFITAYSFGAVVLPAIDNDQAIKITEKGIANNPTEWRLYQHLGYIYWRMKNYEKAGEIYEKGSKIEGAPPFMKMMVAQMKSQGGSRDTARAIYQQMANEASDTQTKEVADLRLMQLDSLDEREAIQKVLDEFKGKNNRCANNFSELFPLLKDVKLPNNKDFRIDKAGNLVDPTDAPYSLNKQTCQIILGETSKIPLQ